MDNKVKCLECKKEIPTNFIGYRVCPDCCKKANKKRATEKLERMRKDGELNGIC